MAKHRKPTEHEDSSRRPKEREHERRNEKRDHAHAGGERESSQPEPGKAPGLAGDVVGR